MIIVLEEDGKGTNAGRITGLEHNLGFINKGLLFSSTGKPHELVKGYTFADKLRIAVLQTKFLYRDLAEKHHSSYCMAKATRIVAGSVCTRVLPFVLIDKTRV